MKKLTLLICFVVCIANSQNNEDSSYASFKLNEIALLNIEPSNSTVILNLGSPEFSGDKIEMIAVINTKWINFTSSLSKNAAPRNISVKIEDGEVPPGISLKLKTDSYSGSGKGILGINSDIISLSKKSQSIVTEIGGAYTGYGTNNGYKITYLLDIYDYKLLNMNESEVLTISLTLTDF